MSEALFKMAMSALKSVLGDFTIKVDRENKKVIIHRKQIVKELTYDQVIDYIEEFFNKQS